MKTSHLELLTKCYPCQYLSTSLSLYPSPDFSWHPTSLALEQQPQLLLPLSSSSPLLSSLQSSPSASSVPCFNICSIHTKYISSNIIISLNKYKRGEKEENKKVQYDEQITKLNIIILTQNLFFLFLIFIFCGYGSLFDTIEQIDMKMCTS